MVVKGTVWQGMEFMFKKLYLWNWKGAELPRLDWCRVEKSCGVRLCVVRFLN
jgi:hypothetical protein